MKYNNDSREYLAPEVEVLELLTESATLTESQIEDYGDNPIFG